MMSLKIQVQEKQWQNDRIQTNATLRIEYNSVGGYMSRVPAAWRGY